MKRLVKDFGSIGCYGNFDIFSNNVYIDWRIRPLDQAFVTVMVENMRELISMSNIQIPTEKYQVEEINEITEFIERNSLPQDCPFLAEVLNLRQYLAKHHDEGVQYVLTDKQVIELLENVPTTVQEFEAIMPRMSSVLRLHVGDFILILMKRAKVFSLDRLKKSDEKISSLKSNNNLYFEESKYRNFQTKDSIKKNIEDLEISSE